MRGTLFLACLYFSPLPSAYAQTAEAVCESLGQTQLIDRYSESSSNFVAQSEFDIFCKQSSSYESSFSQKSSAFKASFAEVGRKFGLGANAASGSGLTKSDFEKICNIGANDFVSTYSRTVSQNVGSTLATIVSDCLKNILDKQLDFVHGTAALTADGDFLLAEVDRRASNIAPRDLRLVAVSPAEYFTSCKVGDQDAIGTRITDNLALSCTLSESAPKEGLEGFLHFRDPAALDQGRTVSFLVKKNEYIRRSEILETARAVAQEVILENSRGVVFAFDREDCPVGYGRYTNAGGRFLRGIDHNSSGVDPDGTRKAGTVQDDAMQNHTHKIAPDAGALVIWHDPSVRQPNQGFAVGAERASVKATETVDGARISTETRPKNVAVSFCVRAD